MKPLLLKPFKIWLGLSAWKQIFIALALGIVTGLSLGQRVLIFKPLGNLFINAIHMIVIPVTFTAIICAILSVTDAQQMRRITFKAFLSYLICMALAATIGILVANIINPGQNFHIFNNSLMLHNAYHIHPINLGNVIENIIPRNPFSAFVHDNILQVVVFALILGISIKLAGEKAQPVAKLFRSFSAVVFKLASIVIRFAPYGIFALIAWTFGKFGIAAIFPLLKFVLTVYIACVLQWILVYSLGMWLVGRLNPMVFLKGASAAIMFAFTTSSSAATLPLSMKCAAENLGVSKNIAQFLLPLGSSFNLNGLSIYLSAATIFAANLYGIHLSIPQYFTIVTTIIFTAMGAAAVPGSALVVMGAVMSSVGVPLGAIALIAGVDRFNDMMQTATNVGGDIFVTTLLAKQEQLFDKEKWHAHQAESTTALVDSLPKNE